MGERDGERSDGELGDDFIAGYNTRDTFARESSMCQFTSPSRQIVWFRILFLLFLLFLFLLMLLLTRLTTYIIFGCLLLPPRPRPKISSFGLFLLLLLPPPLLLVRVSKQLEAEALRKILTLYRLF